uniref:DNA 3'-5' helicase n=1 Tax=Esox lucius TaxID=8010 RepID=A0A6Q2Z168_ESOLU
MSTNYQIWSACADYKQVFCSPQVQTGLYKTNLIDNDLPYLEFTGTVIFSQEKNDCCFLSEDLRSSLSPGSAVGFDIEWPPSFTKGQKKKVALVQLCVSEEKCYLFHISAMSGFPTGLKIFLEDENIRKVGVGIQGDMWKLLSDFDVKLKNIVELGDMANERLLCGEKWSLDGLVKHLFKKRLFKQNDVRCSSWDDFGLSEEQKRYAATDAYVSGSDILCYWGKAKVNCSKFVFVSQSIEFFPPHPDPSLPEPLPEQIKCLKMYFGHSRFKVQWKVINSVLQERRDHLVVMATGYGKSLCFQFPPVYCVGISIVISPLIALMEDQVLQLEMSNIPACYLGSAQTKDVLSGLKLGQYRVAYMTPEYCSGNVSLLVQLNQSIGISLIAVDEAHCISEWGHDFRGAYQSLGSLKRALPDVPIVALTATASPSIREDIVKSLNLERPVVTCTSFDRPNLYLEVSRKSGGIVQDMKGFLKKAAGGDYAFEGSSIVYCPSRKEAERVSSTLSSLGIACGVYHAGLGIRKRRETQHRFMRDEIQCIVATVAFGMGINKPDIRKVIHYGAPKEMESYYQEIGRAGRDGLPSACHVLWAPADLQLNRFLINQVANNRFRGYKLKMMGKMDQYLNSSKCRRKLILSHFEDKQLRKVTSGIMGTDKCCDNCRSGWELTHFVEPVVTSLIKFYYGVLAFQLMGAISAMGERFGSSAPILFLRGSYSQRVPEKYRQHPLFGAGKNVSEACWKALTRHLVNEGYLMEATGASKFCILCKITQKGRTWLRQALNEKHRTLLLQSVDTDLNAWMTLVFTGAHRVPRPQHALVHSCVLPLSKPCSFVPMQTMLYAKLVAERQKLSSEKDIPPAILATNKILLDLARIRPCTVSSLKQVDGVSEAKSSMLEPLLKAIACFCAVHGLAVRPVPGPETVTARPRPSPLPNSIAITYRLFQEEGKSMVRHPCFSPVYINWMSSLISTNYSHTIGPTSLIQAFRANHPLDTERAGLTAALQTTITSIICSHPINSGTDMSPAIRAWVPEHIPTFLIQLTVELLRREGMPTAPPGVSKSQQQPELTWIEPEVSIKLPF